MHTDGWELVPDLVNLSEEPVFMGSGFARSARAPE
jgi:hypothetical protein